MYGNCTLLGAAQTEQRQSQLQKLKSLNLLDLKMYKYESLYVRKSLSHYYTEISSEYLKIFKYSDLLQA